MTRMSCNGCRALRKGCSEDCILKPCLQWIESPQSQANATLFLAKFYGRVGIINLINAGPIHLRPAIFRSLLYEACGRIINPVHGSVGLMCSGDWQRCHEAFEAVLDGSPFIMQMIPTDDHDSQWQEQYQYLTPLQGFDIRRLINDSSASFRRYRFKRSDKSHVAAINRWNFVEGRDKDSLIDKLKWAPSRDSLSVEAVEHFMANRFEQPDFEVKPDPDSTNENGGLGLELSLGLPIH